MYTDQKTVEAHIKRKLTSSEVANIELMIAAAKSYIDKATGQVFTAGGEATTRIYDGVHEGTLFIDAFSEITKVEFVGLDGVTTTVDPNTYHTYPYNADYVNALVRRGTGRWSRGIGTYKVTGTIGKYKDVPADIKLAATILVADMLRNPQNLKSESIEGYSRTFADQSSENPHLEKLLSNYNEVLV